MKSSSPFSENITLQPDSERCGLEEGEIYRIGETRPRKISFKLTVRMARQRARAAQRGREHGAMCEGATLGLHNLPPELAATMAADGSTADALLAAPGCGKLEAAELNFIRDTLRADHGNLTQTARHLGIAKSTLYAKLKKYGLDHIVDDVRASGH